MCVRVRCISSIDKIFAYRPSKYVALGFIGRMRQDNWEEIKNEGNRLLKSEEESYSKTLIKELLNNESKLKSILNLAVFQEKPISYWKQQYEECILKRNYEESLDWETTARPHNSCARG